MSLSLFFAPLQEQTAKGERINKETGELSASGELSAAVELKELEVEGSCGNPQLPQVLKEELQALGIHTCSSPDQRTDHVPLEQREEHLVKVLLLYIQVWTTGTSMCVYLSHIVHPFSELYFALYQSTKGVIYFLF